MKKKKNRNAIDDHKSQFNIENKIEIFQEFMQ